MGVTELPPEPLVWSIIFKAFAICGGILSALGATIGFLLKHYWDSREAEFARREADRLRLRDILYESLKWFEGKSQKRSIGIAVVATSWPHYPEFQPLWMEVYANQAIYLLTASEQGEKLHEQDNLRRILDALATNRALITPASRRILCDTIAAKLRGDISGGLTLSDGLARSLTEWLGKLCD